MEDGPMLAAHETEIHARLDVDKPYVITGEVAAIESKVGRRLGRFDLMTVRIEVAEEAGGAAVATCTNVMVLPRPGEPPPAA
jgi:hypothetical protein